MALVLRIWIRSRVCSSAEIFLNHQLNRRPIFSLHRFNRCLSLRGSVSASSLEQPPTVTPTATGASNGGWMNRCLLAVLPVLMQSISGPCNISGLSSGLCTDDHRIIRCPAGGSSGPPSVDEDSNSFKSGQSYSDVYTDDPFYEPSVLLVL